MAYLTQAEVEARLGTLTTAQASYFNNTLLPAIELFINTTAGTVFASAADPTSVYVSGNDSPFLEIPTMNTVTEVAIVGDDDTTTIIPTTDWVEYPRGETYVYAIRRKSGNWQDGFENYKVTGKLGYSGAVPADIKLVAMEMAVTDLNANVNNYKSERVGDWSVTYADTGAPLSANSLDILRGYKRLSRGV